MSDVRAYKRLALWFASAAAAAAASLLWGRVLLRIFSPFIPALILAWKLDPAVRYAEAKTGLSRRACSLAVCLLCFAAAGTCIGVLAYNVADELLSLAPGLKNMTASLEKVSESILSRAGRYADALPEGMSSRLSAALSRLKDSICGSCPELMTSLAGRIVNHVLKAPSRLLFAAAFAFGTVLFSIRMPVYREFISRITASDSNHPVSLIKTVLLTGLGGYMRAALILGAWVGALCLIAFIIMGQPCAFLLSLLMGICDILPNFGAGTVLVPWAIILLLKRRISGAVILFITAAVCTVTRNMIYPRVMGAQTGLSPLMTVISSFAGWKAAGVTGMILGPLFAVMAVNLLSCGLFTGLKADLKVLFYDIFRIFGGSGDA